MSEAKRAQLIADGLLGPDGERLHNCPTCGKPGFVPVDGARPEAVQVGVTAPEVGG